MCVLLTGDLRAVREALAHCIAEHPAAQVVSDESPRSGGVNPSVVAIVQASARDFTTLSEVRREFASIPVVLIAPHVDPSAYGRALALGAAGVLHLDERVDVIVDKLIAVAHGRDLVASDEVVSRLVAAHHTDAQRRRAQQIVNSVTPREREILQLVANGESVSGIATALHLSVHTVRNHVARLHAKLGVTNQIQAVVLGHSLGLIVLPAPLPVEDCASDAPPESPGVAIES